MAVRVVTADWRDQPKRHYGIKCLTCKALVSKAELPKRHRGHDVVYLKADGTPDE